MKIESRSTGLYCVMYYNTAFCGLRYLVKKNVEGETTLL